MGRLPNENDVLDRLYDDEEIIYARDYNIYVLDTAQKFENYTKESEKLLTNYVETSDVIKKVSENIRENVLLFLSECDSLAQKMSGGILSVYQKNRNRICVTIICDEVTFRESEIQSLIKLCALTTRIEFFSAKKYDENGATVDFFFELSEDSFTLANLINSIRDEI